MREILFRAKRENWKELPKKEWWVEGYYVKCRGHHYILPVYDSDNGFDERYSDWIEVIPETVRQYTGLTDKNGKKIFEGDIVKDCFNDDYGSVEFGTYKNYSDLVETKHCGFYIDWREKKYFRKDFGCLVNMVDAEIVGNIFDNPELLKKGAEDE